MRIDKRKNYYIVLDTETAPKDNTIEEVRPDNMLAYDVGFAVIDKKGKVYEKYSFVIKEIFFNNTLMKSAYYYNKVPQYLEDIIKGTRKVVAFDEMKKILFKTFHKYHCKAIICHNARFDYGTLNATQEFLTSQKYFFPYGFSVWDSLKMSRDVLKDKKSYINFCFDNGYVTKHKKPRPQLKAEVIYKYISGDNNFVECHTGLEDVEIEIEIFAYCIRQHKKMRKALFA